jgi:glycosyltransferase involved in cell wall biosynthesis
VNTLISICIPTYRRPALLRIAVSSALAQTYPDIEVIVGDDSPDGLSAEVVEALRATAVRPIRYEHNKPGLGQNENVNRLFSLARGDRLILCTMMTFCYLMPRCSWIAAGREKRP